MEKQPVDDLFARKLRDVEVPVGSDVFSQLQQRMGTKPLITRRPLAMWWYMAGAACILIALGMVYITTKNNLDDKQPVAHKESLRKSQAVPASSGNEIIAKSVIKDPQIQGDSGYNEERLAPTFPIQKAKLSRQKAEQERASQPSEVIDQVAVLTTQPIQEVTRLPIKVVTPIEEIARVEKQPRHLNGRTIVLTIEEPEASNLASADNHIAVPATQQHVTGLSGLFGKIKQLKSGEVLAKANSADNQSTTKNRFGRVLTEVKESLKNETTLE